MSELCIPNWNVFGSYTPLWNDDGVTPRARILPTSKRSVTTLLIRSNSVIGDEGIILYTTWSIDSHTVDLRCQHQYTLQPSLSSSDIHLCVAGLNLRHHKLQFYAGASVGCVKLGKDFICILLDAASKKRIVWYLRRFIHESTNSLPIIKS
jgi:hypothetical protein